MISNNDSTSMFDPHNNCQNHHHWHSLYWNYCHNLFLVKYFHKIGTKIYLHIIALRTKLQLSRRQHFLKDHGINSSIAFDIGCSSRQCMQGSNIGQLEVAIYLTFEDKIPYKTLLIGFARGNWICLEEVNVILFPPF